MGNPAWSLRVKAFEETGNNNERFTMPSAARLVKKEAFAERIFEMLDTYSSGFIVHADNVSSKQFMDVRRGVRETSAILMGKNTMVRRAFRVYAEKSGNDFWNQLAALLVGNVGVVFTKSPLLEIKEEIAKHKVGAPAKAGSIAPIESSFLPEVPVWTHPRRLSS